LIRKTITAAAAAIAIIAATGAQGGCGSSSSAGHTVTVPGDKQEAVTCNEVPYDSNLGAKDTDGTGIAVSHGLIRGAMWVSCTGAGPDTFQITVTLLRNGIAAGDGRVYTALPNTVGYSASVFMQCQPGVYRLQYRYKWTLEGGVQSDTNTVSINETVTQHDCDA
jgi:hypothetical protein